jgi:hypothetical protein
LEKSGVDTLEGVQEDKLVVEGTVGGNSLEGIWEVVLDVSKGSLVGVLEVGGVEGRVVLMDKLLEEDRLLEGSLEGGSLKTVLVGETLWMGRL